MGLLLLPIPITLIPIQATCQERLWRGELELVQVAAELGLVQVQAEPERDLVVAVAVRGLVEAEPELAPGVAEPVRGHPRARLAVALRTKSVTAAHRRDLPLLAAEDLVAGAAETTREPAAAEAVIAWEVAE